MVISGRVDALGPKVGVDLLRRDAAVRDDLLPCEVRDDLPQAPLIWHSLRLRALTPCQFPFVCTCLLDLMDCAGRARSTKPDLRKQEMSRYRHAHLRL